MSLRALACTAALLPTLAGCGGDEPVPPPTPPAPVASTVRIAHPATLEELARWFQDAQTARNVTRLGELGASVTPTAAEVRGLMREGEATDAFMMDYAAKGPIDWKADSDSAKGLAAGLFAPGDPKRTEVKAYPATTEEIAAYEPSGRAFEEFPGGMRRFAEKVAAPGITWWIVECVPPASSSGMKFSCFTRRGDRWLFVAKPWRSIQRDRSEGEEAPDPK